ncbi:MAG: hypothetical protein JWP12_3134 [Bacteroidetes bacterium]|nr:hypothetical protein [Bacteroidota bacterium]
MKKKLLFLLIAVTSLTATNAFAQCANSAAFTPGNLTPSGVGSPTAVTYGAGQYVLAYVQAGANYSVTTCGSSSYDTQLTVYDDASGAFYAYNDDYCGLQSNTSFTPPVCGYVRVILMQYSCNGSGLTATVTMSMNSAPGPLPTITALHDTATCPGIPVVIGDSTTVSSGTPPYRYMWMPTANLNDTSLVEPTATIDTTTSFILLVKDANNCPVRDTLVVTAYPVPTRNLGNDTAQCGGMVLLNAGNAGAAYLWNNSTTAQTLSVGSTQQYSVTVTNANGCINSDTVQVTINTIPVVNLGMDTTQCTGTIVLDAGNAGSNYLWNDSTMMQTLTASTSGMYYIAVTNPVTSCHAADSIQVTIDSIPVVNLGMDTTQCGGTIVLDAGNTGLMYLWNDGTTTQTLTSATSGMYAVTVTNGSCTASSSINVTINAIPTVTIDPVSTVCENYPAFTLTGTPAGGTYTGTGVSASTFDPAMAGTGTFVVTYTVTDSNSCTSMDSTSIMVDICTGIASSNASELDVYPNPAKGMFNIVFTNADFDHLIISITDIQGKEVYSFYDKNNSAEYRKTISTEGLAKGIYYIKLNTGKNIRMKKLVIQ